MNSIFLRYLSYILFIVISLIIGVLVIYPLFQPDKFPPIAVKIAQLAAIIMVAWGIFKEK